MPRVIMSADGDVLASYAPYLESALADLDAIVPYIKEGLTSFEGCDTIVGRGLSGALTVPYIARALGLHWAIARKAGDGSHSTECIEGTIGRRWVFVDDLISSGNTLTKTIISVNVTADKVGYETEFLGAVTYAPFIVWSYSDVCGCLPKAFDPNARPEPKPAKWPKPDSDFTDAFVASLATPQPYDTQDENGNPVYAPPPRPDGWFIASDYDINPCLDPDWLAKKRAEQFAAYNPKAPRPTKRGGKARRMLMELEGRMEDQRRAMNDKLDLALTNQMLNLLQEKLR